MVQSHRFVCKPLLQIIMIFTKIPKKIKIPNIRPLFLRNNHMLFMFSSDSKNKYANKSSRQIERQIGLQKWKQLQNTFKSLNTSFGLKPPSQQAIKDKDYSKPKKIDYTLQSLRECSHQYPVYLYMQLEDQNSSFHKVIDRILQNLWKAQQKQTLQILDFLYHWNYKKIDVESLYRKMIKQMDLDLFQIFQILKKYQTGLQEEIEIKILQRLRNQKITYDQYGPLLRIINLFTLHNMLSHPFYISVTNSLTNNINSISPSDVLESYVFYTYNMHQNQNLIAHHQQPNPNNKAKVPLQEEICSIIEKRIFAQECLKFYKSDELIALLHTFLKNNVVLAYEESYYETRIKKIVERIELLYIAQDFTTDDKIRLLKICQNLPVLSKQMVIALIQKQLLKKNDKFDAGLLVDLYRVSYDHNMLTDELLKKMQEGIIDNVHNISQECISRAAWLFIVTGAPNTHLLHKKIETIIEGGLRDYSIKDVCVIVWSMCAVNYNQNGSFWSNIQSYLTEQLRRIREKQIQGGTEQNTINICSWILWAYLNNKQLSLKTIDYMCGIIIDKLGRKEQPLVKQKVNKIQSLQEQQQQQSLTPFELINIVSFFYSIDLPSKSVSQKIQQISYQQFSNIYRMMECIELCKILKFMGWQVWSNQELAEGIIEIFQISVDEIKYRDIMPVVATLLNSGLKGARVKKLVVKLMEKKKRMQSLEQSGSEKGQQHYDPSQKTITS